MDYNAEGLHSQHGQNLSLGTWDHEPSALYIEAPPSTVASAYAVVVVTYSFVAPGTMWALKEA